MSLWALDLNNYMKYGEFEQATRSRLSPLANIHIFNDNTMQADARTSSLPDTTHAANCQGS